MKISKRLKKIASLVDKNVNVVDIGCDHALLDIYLTLNNNNKCIASDLRQNIIEQALKNIEKYNLENKIKLITSDGTKNIKIPLNSTIVISGMGASTIVNILQNTDHTNIDNLVIQSNNDLELLRKKTILLNYYIFDEEVIYDKNKYYVIIKFKKGYKKYTKKELEFGPVLIHKKNKETKEFFKNIYDSNLYLIKKLNIKHLRIIIKYLVINRNIKKLNLF